MSDIRVVLMSMPDAAQAEALVRDLVEARLAACGNVLLQATSIYRWQGAVENAGEVLVLLKTTAARADQLLRRAAELHPYDVPEILLLPVLAGHAPYLAWVEESVADGGT